MTIGSTWFEPSTCPFDLHWMLYETWNDTCFYCIIFIAGFILIPKGPNRFQVQDCIYIGNPRRNNLSRLETKR